MDPNEEVDADEILWDKDHDTKNVLYFMGFVFFGALSLFTMCKLFCFGRSRTATAIDEREEDEKNE